MGDNLLELESFNKKLSVLCEIPTLLNENDFELIQFLKQSKDELDKMPNVHYYIKSDDLIKVTKITNKNVYLRLIIDSPRKFKNNETTLVDQKEHRDQRFSPRKFHNDSMSLSDSPGRSSSSSETVLQAKKSKRLSKRIDNIDYSRKEISVKSENILVYYTKSDSKYSVFILRKKKDNIIYCTAANDEDIRGSRIAKLLKHETIELNMNNTNISIHTPNLSILTYPIYFIFNGATMTIDEFMSVAEYIISTYLHI
jgi:hypothetical protein